MHVGIFRLAIASKVQSYTFTCYYTTDTQVESKSAATDLEARAILHLQQLGLARVLNLRVGGRAR